jgi:hypothetical protein
MIECFDGDLSEDDLYAYLAGGDSIGVIQWPHLFLLTRMLWRVM